MVHRSVAAVCLCAVVVLHVLYSPYTKVEEQWTLHATHDMLEFGSRPDALSLVRCAASPVITLKGAEVRPQPESWPRPSLLCRSTASGCRNLNLQAATIALALYSVRREAGYPSHK
jgi:hypothetical protein